MILESECVEVDGAVQPFVDGIFDRFRVSFRVFLSIDKLLIVLKLPSEFFRDVGLDVVLVLDNVADLNNREHRPWLGHSGTTVHGSGKWLTRWQAFRMSAGCPGRLPRNRGLCGAVRRRSDNDSDGFHREAYVRSSDIRYHGYKQNGQ